MPAPLSGKDLYENGLKQLQDLSVPTRKEELLSIEYEEGYLVHTATEDFHTKALILATGTKSKYPFSKRIKKI